MSIENKNFLVGVTKNEDGTLDYSKSAKIIDNNFNESVISKEEANNILFRLHSASEFERSNILSQIAKEKNQPKEKILENLRMISKEKILFSEKVTHYHLTSFENFKSIVEMGKLLSRSNIKKSRPDAKIPSWSASDDVMMTRDIYDKDGKIIKQGITAHGVGASGSGVILVMNKNIMSLDNYDAIGEYPTVSDASLADNCEAILVKDKTDLVLTKKILEENNLSIPIYIENEWLNSKYSINK